MVWERGENKAYAVGDQKFSSNLITATIVATWTSGSLFIYMIERVYLTGLTALIPILGLSLMFWLVGYWLVLRMQEFLGVLSIAEAMGNLYGSLIRKITSKK